MNKVILKGNLGADVEVTTLPSGTSVAEFSLATNRRWTDKDGERQEETDWHRCKLYGTRSEVVAQYTNKGDELLVEGRISYRTYEDKDGNTKYFTEIILDDFHFIRNGGGESREAPAPKSTKKTSKTPAAKGKKATAKKKVQVEEDDDLPF